MDDELDHQLATLRAHLDEGIAELDAGLGVETTAEQLIADALNELEFDQ